MRKKKTDLVQVFRDQKVKILSKKDPKKTENLGELNSLFVLIENKPVSGIVGFEYILKSTPEGSIYKALHIETNAYLKQKSLIDRIVEYGWVIHSVNMSTLIKEIHTQNLP